MRDTVLYLLHSLQRQVPTSFKFARNQTVFWIGSIILPLSPLGRIPGRLQIPLESGPSIVLILHLFLARQQRCLDRYRLYHSKYLRADCVMRRNASKSDTARFTVVKPSAITGVTQHLVLTSCVSYCQLTTTPPASQQPS